MKTYKYPDMIQIVNNGAKMEGEYLTAKSNKEGKNIVSCILFRLCRLFLQFGGEEP
jgi:hypothetical protein